MSTELLLGGREAFAPARPTVTHHAIPSPDEAFTRAHNAFRTSLDIEGNVKNLREWLASPKALGAYEQVVRFPSFYSVQRFLAEDVKRMEDMYSERNRRMLANDRIGNQSGAPATNQARDVQHFAEMLRSGWPKGRERLANEALNFHRQYQHIVAAPTWERELVGEEVDVPAFLAGMPEHMIGYHMSQALRKAINVTVEVGVRCSACGIRSHDVAPTNPTALMVRGLMAAMMVQQLARAGHAVTLRTISYSNTPYDPGAGYRRSNVPNGWLHLTDLAKNIRELSDRPVNFDTSNNVWFQRTVVVDVLTPGEPMNLDNVMLALAHEGWQRQFDFAVSEYYGNLPPFTNATTLQEAVNNLSPYDRSNHFAAGWAPVWQSWRMKLVSAVDTRADIFIPAIHAPQDITSLAVPNEGNLPLLRELFGANYAITGPLASGQLDIPALARETHELLKSVGVEFQ